VRVEVADVSLIGDRDENQDWVAVASTDDAVLLVAMDGMGGHVDGGRAAETGCRTLLGLFAAQPKPLFDPQGFLHLGLGRAHAEVVALGGGLPLDLRPRATCAVCLVQRGEAWWAHIGDSRVYHFRGGAVRTRTRDHSHVEQLLREGSIHEDEVRGHPLRNYVECCLGGEPALPEMSLSGRVPLADGDVLLVCTDGVWTHLRDAELAACWMPGARDCRETLQELASAAVRANAPHSDNASAAVLCWRA